MEFPFVELDGTTEGGMHDKISHMNNDPMLDPLWIEASSAIKLLPTARGVVGPEELKSAVENTRYCSYADYDGSWKPSYWVLHRGLPEHWPQHIYRKLTRQKYSVLWSNELFSIIKTRLIRMPLPNLQGEDANHHRSLLAIIERLKTESLLREQSDGHRPAQTSGPTTPDRYQIDALIRQLIDVKGWESKNSPNTSATGEMARDLQIMKANIKALAWQLEKLESPNSLDWAPITESVATNSEKVEATCRLCTSSDIYSEWHRRLSASLRAKNYKLRKIWEWTYTIKVLYDHGFLSGNSSGLGFGCGTEPLASCFANFVDALLITDAPPHVIEGKGWSDTNQHTASLEQAKHEWLAPKERMDKVMHFEFADMNDIPSEYFNLFDFVWSSCALEHLGSKRQGLEFIAQSALCLRPGGIAVHTTEYDLSGQSTIDNWETVLFNEKDFNVTLADMLNIINQDGTGRHFELCPFDLRRGRAFIDGYVDIPPYSYHAGLNESFQPDSSSLEGTHHPSGTDYPYPQINLSVDGFPCTSIAILVRRVS